MRTGAYDLARCACAVLEFVAEERQLCECLRHVWSVHFCNSAFRFVNAEEMVAPWDGVCLDIDVKIDDLDSSDADEDDDDDD